MGGDLGDAFLSIKISRNIKENTKIQKEQLGVLKEIRGLLKGKT